jgi:hypothetical protein
MKDKLACGTILLNVVHSLLHHVTCVETTKDAWDNLCATFEKTYVDSILQLHQELYNLKMEEGTLVQTHIDKLSITYLLTNINH